MAELVVIGYPDEPTARRGFATTVGLQRELILAGAASRASREHLLPGLPPTALRRGNA
ncbi:MAG: hypothetical protein ACXWNI_06185 [Candidatus Limnocylindrales bacterium]